MSFESGEVTGSATMIAASGDEPPGYLIALNPSLNHREFVLRHSTTRIGREGEQCNIVVAGKTISRVHCEIVRTVSGFTLRDCKSTNGVFVNGKRISADHTLHEGEIIGLGGETAEHFRFQHESGNRPWTYTLPPKKAWTIGRHPSTDITLAYESTISSLHATVTAKGDGLELTDNNSLNGTWVNGRRIRKATLSPTDAVMIGSTVLRFATEPDQSLRVIRRDCGEGISLECVGLTREIGGGKRILDRVSLAIKPGEFVGLLGPSGAGKSTLLKALNGYNPPSYGAALLNETPLYPCFDLFRHTIGYVPQDDIVHQELTVSQSLDYVAKLRLPADVSAEQRQELVDTTIESLGLGHVKSNRIHELSGGQRKRVSIGCELITRPSVLFLDEPTSGMDPSTEERLMRLFQDMARKGTTILITTHILYNLDLLDRVVILSRGRLVFFGTPREAMSFFTTEGKPVERPTQIFEILEAETPTEFTPGEGDKKAAVAEFFQQKYMKSDLFRKHVRGEYSPFADDLLEISDKPVAPAAPPREHTGATTTNPGARRNYEELLKKPTAGAGRAFSLDLFSPRSFWNLTRRNFSIKLVSPKRALFYLAAPLILALVTLSLRTTAFPDDAATLAQRDEIATQIQQGSPAMGPVLKQLLSPDGAEDTRTAAEVVYALKYEGLSNLPTPISVLLMFVMTAVFMGTLMACLDLSTERPIYLRERMANQKIADYLGSKLPFLLLLTALQCALVLGICLLKPTLREFDVVHAYLALLTMSWTAVAIGLFLSAVDPTPGQFSVILAIIVVLPQLVLSGGLAPDFFAGMPEGMQWAANLLPARWGLEMLMSAFYHHPDSEALAWTGKFVEDSVGFNFGPGVYLKNAAILLLQAAVWMGMCAWALKRQDRVR
ncbi:MAG: FHA domain-containing protein [Candidatus Hydrogenedentes bacterium]|nr:FHA domain-containing protein [Candidatus Hydrogenedentota bacterium]